MKRLLLVLVIIILNGCSSASLPNQEYFESEEEAIDQLLEQVGSGKVDYLQKEVEGHTFLMIVESGTNIGFATISEIDSKYTWSITPGYVFLHKEPEVSTSVAEVTTKSDQVFYILFGRVNDNEISKVNLVQSERFIKEIDVHSVGGIDVVWFVSPNKLKLSDYEFTY